MTLTTRDILALPESPQKRAMLAQLRTTPVAAVAVAVGGEVSAEGAVAALSVTLVLKTISEANARDEFRRISRKKKQRTITRETLRCCPLPALPVTVRLTRVGLRTLDTDNLSGAMKFVRDGAADAYSIDDADPRISWEYDQERGKRGMVRIGIEQRKVATP